MSGLLAAGGIRVERPGILLNIRGVAHLTGSTLDATRARRDRGQLLAPVGRIGQADMWWADEVVRWNAAGRPGREAWAARAARAR